MEERVVARIDELSSRVGDLIRERESRIQELRSLDSELENLTAILFELKSLIDLEDHTSEIKD